jgi:hemerythrin-like domain-containing protein
MAENATDVTDMLAVHDALRHEFAGLPLKVKAVADGDAERASTVGGHVLLMADFIDVHHASEDELVWPLLKERSPEHDELVETMGRQHVNMDVALTAARQQAAAWMASPGNQERAALHTTLIGLERDLLHHLAMEEQEALPLIQRDLSEEEWAAVGEHSRAALSPEKLTIVLGLILDDTSDERGAAILASMPPEAREGFEQFGRPAYKEYKARLTNY